jgi:pimeloyl-ACP methyl ester carboxylesterase
LKFLETSLLKIGYEAGGPSGGPRVLFLHGWPDDATGFAKLVPLVEKAGFQWAAPYLRGFGPTEFLSATTFRDGSAAALAQDAIEFVDGLGWTRFAVIGHDWGARAGYALAAVIPDRLCMLAALALAYSPRGAFPTPSYEQSRRWWYQWFMTTDRGADAVRRDPKGFARIQWDTWSPPGWFQEEDFEAAAQSFSNPDWVPITLHGYRSRWRSEHLDPEFDPIRERIRATEQLEVPTVMIQGGADAWDPPSESENQHRLFPAGYSRVVLEGIGHFPAREDPQSVAKAILPALQLNAPADRP